MARNDKADKTSENASENARGAVITTITALTFAINDALMKLIVAGVSLYQALFIRGLMVMPLIIGLAYYSQQIKLNLSSKARRFLYQRSLLEAALSFFMLNALANLPLAVVVVVLQVAPLCLTFYAAIVYGETVGWRRWAAIFAGFIGVIIVVSPSSQTFDPNIFYAIATVLCLMGRDLLTRRMPANIPVFHTVLWTATATLIFGGAIMPFTGWVDIGFSQYMYLAMSSVMIIMAYWLSVVMMRVGDIGFVSQFRYTGVLWAILFGALFFDEKPDMPTLIGATVIVSAGLYSLSRERKSAHVKK